MTRKQKLDNGGVLVTYEGHQHCSAEQREQGLRFAMDCPDTGRGDELSPNNLIGASLAGCMFLSMGTLARRNKLDISGAWMEVDVVPGDDHIKAIEVTCHMPTRFSETDRAKLERAAAQCPITSSFRQDIPVSIKYRYEEKGAAQAS